MRVIEFVEAIKPEKAPKMLVTLDNKIYPTEFGVTVRPLCVRCGARVIDMKELIEIFGKVPYISIKESRYRSIYRSPMIMTIMLTPKQYEDHTYYDYYIDKLCLRNELKTYETIRVKAHESIKEYKGGTVESVDELREQDSTSNLSA